MDLHVQNRRVLKEYWNRSLRGRQIEKNKDIVWKNGSWEKYVGIIVPTNSQMKKEQKWTKQEEKRLTEKTKGRGTKWKVIQEFFPGRSPLYLHSKWWSLQNRRRAKYISESHESDESIELEDEDDEIAFDDDHLSDADDIYDSINKQSF